MRHYFTALEGGDAEDALAAVAPSARARWTGFVENGLFNDYQVQGIAVRHSSILDSARGAPTGPREVTVFLTITEAVSGARWQAGPTVPLVAEGGRLYLGRPPLAEPPV